MTPYINQAIFFAFIILLSVGIVSTLRFAVCAVRRIF